MVLGANSPYRNCTDPYTDQVGGIPGAAVQFSVSLLSGQLHFLLGRVQFQADFLEEPAVEGQAPILKDTWYIDSLCHGQPLTYETGAGQPSQWAEFCTVWLVLMNDTGPDSWAVYQGLTL